MSKKLKSALLSSDSESLGASDQDDDFDPGLHDMLRQNCLDSPMSKTETAFLAAGGEDDEDDTNPGEWTLVTDKKRSGVRVPTKRITDDQIATFARMYRDYFFAYTGKRLTGFSLTTYTHPYVSELECSRKLCQTLSKFFDSPPEIWELFAGSGADTISFLLHLNPKKLHACQKFLDEASVRNSDISFKEFEIFQNNLTAFDKAFKGTKFSLYHKYAHDFIRERPNNSQVDMIHLDPSWDSDKEGKKLKYELSPNDLFQVLNESVFQPIRDKNIQVGLYVIKTRWDWLDIQTIAAHYLPEFIALDGVRVQQFINRMAKTGPHGEVKGVYHYMILVHKTYKQINANLSQMYWNNFRNGIDFWVQKKTCIGLIKPTYGVYNHFPTISMSKPEDEENWLLITPVEKPGYREIVKAEDLIVPDTVYNVATSKKHDRQRQDKAAKS